MRRKRGVDEDEQGWLTSFGDVTTLLLTFFVMVFACSAIGGEEALKTAFESILKGLKIEKEEKVAQPDLLMGALKGGGEFTAEERTKLLEVLAELEALKEKLGGFEIKITDLGLVVSAENDILFELGSARLKGVAKALLEAIFKLYEAKECEFAVYGHTCDLPIHTVRFPSNWELSAGRALAVVKFFLNEGVKGERLSAIGCADTYPAAPNTCEANRKLNRRVEIYIDFGRKKM